MLAPAQMMKRKNSHPVRWWMYTILGLLTFLVLVAFGFVRSGQRIVDGDKGPPLLQAMKAWEPLNVLLPTFAAAWEVWMRIRAAYLAPVLQVALNICIGLYLFHSVDKLVYFAKCLWIKVAGKKYLILQKPPHHRPSAETGLHVEDPFVAKSIPDVGRKPWEKMHSHPEMLVRGADVPTERELSSENYWRPSVLIQLPMYNERECFQQIIEACCNLQWPWDRLLIQVLDDSDDINLSKKISEEADMWHRSGAEIHYLHRTNRSGQKAGALKYGMSMEYAKNYDFVVIFDADFIPDKDYLLKTVPLFYGRPKLALVQARWAFYNSNLNLLTKFQRVSLDFHFEVEQQVMGYYTNFMNFNGTAGVWRCAAIEDAGGWESRTTTEDMDMAVRAHLKGWEFIFLNDLGVPCELPATYEGYCKQQYRWHAGPMQLFLFMWKQILYTKNFPFLKKINLIAFFFIIRKLAPPVVSFFTVILLPASIFIPEAAAPNWIAFNVPIFFTSLYCVVSDWWLFPLVYPFFLLENILSLTKATAVIDGLFGREKAKQWVVTGKTGTVNEKAEDPLLKAPNSRKSPTRKVQIREMIFAVYVLSAAWVSFFLLDRRHFFFLLCQGIGFLFTGLDLLTSLGI